MPDSIKELIVKNVVAALEGILVANGYSNDIASVQRPMPRGNDFSNAPMCMVIQDDDDKEAVSEHYIQKRFVLVVVACAKIDTETDARSVTEVLNSLEADIEKALTVNPNACRRGGYALDTQYLGTGEYVPQPGQPDIGVAVAFEISYRHRVGDPYTQ